MPDSLGFAVRPRERPEYQRRESIFVGGAWQPATGKRIVEILDSATEAPIAEVREASLLQLDTAIEAARSAQVVWGAMPPSERAVHLRRLHDELASRADAIASLIAAEVGTPLRIARSIQVGLPLTVLSSYADLIEEFEFEGHIGNSKVVLEPVGVVAAITPWNYPLHQAMAKVAAALAGGSTVILKPSSLAPLSLFTLAEAVEAAGLPPGVFNLLPGLGGRLGVAIAKHPSINMVSFTGSTAAGVQVATGAAKTVKRVALELGGKSANVILDDADLQHAVTTGVNNAFLNSGQTCSAWTRMLVPQTAVNDVTDIAREASARLRLGDPFDEDTRLGPLVSSDQVSRVRSYVERGLEEGAQLVLGGPARPDGVERGFYFRPTVFSGVTPEMVIAREEIFGPVLAIMPYSDEADALRIANATEYGLAGAVWSSDVERATRFARGMKTGQVDVNGGRFNPTAPFGGYRKSGIGRELGRHGLEEFLEVKSIQF